MFKKKVNKLEIKLPENIKSTYELSYMLTYEEAYESFYLLANKSSKQWRMIVGIILTMIALVMQILSFIDNTKIHYSYIAVIAIGLLFYLIYVPVLKARRGAKRVEKQKGYYKIKVTDNGKLILSNSETIDLSNDKDARAIETSKVFSIRPDARNTLCIPKRIMNKEEEDGIRTILKTYLRYQVQKTA